MQDIIDMSTDGSVYIGHPMVIQLGEVTKAQLKIFPEYGHDTLNVRVHSLRNGKNYGFSMTPIPDGTGYVVNEWSKGFLAKMKYNPGSSIKPVGMMRLQEFAAEMQKQDRILTKFVKAEREYGQWVILTAKVLDELKTLGVAV